MSGSLPSVPKQYDQLVLGWTLSAVSFCSGVWLFRVFSDHSDQTAKTRNISRNVDAGLDVACDVLTLSTLELSRTSS